MKAARLFGLLVLMLVGSGEAAWAGLFVQYQAPTGGGLSSTLKTVFGLGLQWDFGDQKPQVVGSIRRTRTSTTNEVVGGKLDVAIPLFPDSFTSPTIRLLALAGDRSI